MAILSEFGVICDAEVLTTGTGTHVKEGGQIDLGKADPGDIGVGEPLFFVATVNEEIKLADDASDGTFTIRLVTDAVSGGFDANSSVLKTATFVTKKGNATSGKVLVKGKTLIAAPLGQEGVEYLRFLGVTCDVGTTALAGGKIDAYITKAVPKVFAYPDGAPVLD